MIRRRSIQAIAWLFVFAHLFGSGKGALALSVISASMDDSHAISFAYEHGEVHLILRHAGGLTGVGQAVENLQVRMPSTGHDQHADHEIHLSDFEHPLTTATKTPSNSETPASAAISMLPVDQVEESFLSCAPDRPPDVNSHLRSLRAVVLLI